MQKPAFPENAAALGEEVRALRRIRRLSLAQAASRAGVTPGALGNWENGRRTPRGAPLKRLLEALMAPGPLRARLLALADPAFARIELEHGDLGAPVPGGSILRALRMKAGVSQGELARRLGVVQSTVARWEMGDDVPEGGLLQSALFALGVPAEEAMIAVRATPGASPQHFEERFVAISNAPHALQEALSLSLERDLWWSATVEPGTEGLLARTTAHRANWCALEERTGEVRSLVRRASRLADAAGARGEATAAVLSLAQIRLNHGEDPHGVARTVGEWAEGIAGSANRAWSLSTQAIALAAKGDDRAVPLARAAIPMGCLHHPDEGLFRRIDLAEVYLALGESHRALDVLDEDHTREVYRHIALGRPPWGLSTRARALAAAGETPEPELLPALRAYVARTGIPRYARELRQAGRALARAERRRA